MAIATFDPHAERTLLQAGGVINKLKRRGIITDVLVAAATDVNDLIADTYAALRSGTIELYGPTDLMLVRRFEQIIKYMEKRGLLTTAIVAALLTVNTVAAVTDLRYLASNAVTNTNLDFTTESSAGFEMQYSYPTTR